MSKESSHILGIRLTEAVRERDLARTQYHDLKTQVNENERRTATRATCFRCGVEFRDVLSSSNLYTAIAEQHWIITPEGGLMCNYCHRYEPKLILKSITNDRLSREFKVEC